MQAIYTRARMRAHTHARTHKSDHILVINNVIEPSLLLLFVLTAAARGRNVRYVRHSIRPAHQNKHPHMVLKAGGVAGEER